MPPATDSSGTGQKTADDSGDLSVSEQTPATVSDPTRADAYARAHDAREGESLEVPVRVETPQPLDEEPISLESELRPEAESPSVSVPEVPTAVVTGGPRQTPRIFSLFRFNRTALLMTTAILVVLALLVGVAVALFNNNRQSLSSNNGAGDYSTGKLSLGNIQPSDELQVGAASQLSINGLLKVNDSFVLVPTTTPTAPVAGQFYYNKADNTAYFYNGTQFVSLAPAHVSSIGGQAGAITLDTSLQITNNNLGVSNTLLQQIAGASANGGPHVTSVQGVSGAVTLNGGSGITINGTTISNSGLVSLTSGSGNLVITNDGAGNYTITDSGGGGGVTSLTGTPNQIIVSSSTGNVTLSLPQDINVASAPTFGGLTVTGSLAVQGAGGLTVGNTGVDGKLTLTSSGGGSIALQSGSTASNLAFTLPVADGSNGYCLKTNGSGTLSFQQCTGGAGGGVSSLNNQTDIVVLNNATGSGGFVTIDNAKADGATKGIATFNSTNFSDNGSGGINTIQDISTAATPTFAGLTINGTATATTLNATSVIQLNGTSINVAGTLSNVAYLNGTGPQTFSGNNKFTGTVTAQLTSPTAFQVQDGLGTSNLFVANTSTDRIGIGTLGPGYKLDVQGGDINTSGIYRVNGAQISSADLSNDSNLAKLNGTNTFSAANTFSSTVSIQGANSLTLGSGSNVGSIIFRDGSSANTGTLQLAGVLSGNVTYSLPVATGSQTVCTVETGNCAGSGSGITGSGTTNKLAKFTGSQAIGDSSISDDGTVVTVTTGQIVQGAAGLTIGTTGVDGKIVLTNSVNSNTLTLQSGATTGNLTLTLPTADGSNGNCLKTNGSGVLSFASCTGGAGGGVTSINTLTGVLNIVGTANQVSVSSAGDTITLSLPQDINTGGNANFRTVTLTGQAAGDNLIVANAVSGATGDLIDLQVNGVSQFTVTPNGNVNTVGQYQVNGVQIASSDLSDGSNLAKLDGTGPQVFTGDNQFTGTTQVKLDAPAAFSVENSTGTSHLLVADTTTSRVGIGTNAPNYTLDVNGDVNTSGVYRINGVTVCSATGCTPSGGSGNYIQNGTTPQTADFNITGSGTVGSFTDTGTALFQTATDSTTAFQIQNHLGTSNLLVADTTNSLIGVGMQPTIGNGMLQVAGAVTATGTIAANAGTSVQVTIGNNCTTTNNAICFGNSINLYNYNNGAALATDGLFQSGNLYTTGALSFGTFHMTSFTTPTGASVDTKINIPLFDPGAFSQLIALGLPSGSATSARAITVFDARTTTNNQPPLAVISPNEGNIFGLSWEGGNTTGYLKVGSGGAINLRSGSNDLASFNSGGSATFKTYSGVTNAFQLLDNNNNTYLQADSANHRLGVGLSAAPANGVLTVGTNTTAASGGVYFGTDTNLYRSNTNELTTDGHLIVANGISTWGDIWADDTISAGDQICANSLGAGASCIGNVGPSSQAGLLLGSSGDTNLYRGAANQLNTDGSLFVNGNIGVGGTVNIQGTDLTTSATTFNLLNTTATTLNIGGAVGAGGINLAGGSGSTGCTIDGSNGNLTCSGNITGGSTGTIGYWTRSAGLLQPATAGDSITTTGTITGSSLKATSLDTATATTLNIGTATQNVLNIGRSAANTTITGGNVFLSGNTSVLSGGTFAVQSGYASITGLSSGTNTTLRVNNHTSTGAILELQDAATNVLTVADGGAALFKNTVNSAAAFQVQDFGSTPVLTVDTTNDRVGIGSVAPSTTLSVYNGNESTTQTDFTQSLTKGGINIVTDFTDGAYTPGIFWSTQDNNPTKPKAGIYLQENGSSGTSLLFGTSGAYSTGITNTALTLGPNGSALFKNSAGSATGFQVQDQYGTGLLTVNTSANTVAVSKLFIDTLGASGTTALCLNGSSQVSTCSGAGANTLQGAYDGGHTINLASATPIVLTTANSGDTALYLQVASGNTPLINWDNGTQAFGMRSDDNEFYIGEWTGSTLYHNFNIWKDGSVYLQNSTDSATAFQVQNTNNDTILSVDTTGNGALNVSGVDGWVTSIDQNSISFSRDSANYITASDASGQLFFGAGGGSNNLVLDTQGAATFKNSNDSPTAFQVQNAGGDSILNVDSQHSTVTVSAGTDTAVLGTELFNGSFSGSGWTKSGTGQSATGTHTSGTAALQPNPALAITNGNSYLVSWTITNPNNGGTLTITMGGQTIMSYTFDANDSGTYSFDDTAIITASSTANLQFTPNGSFTGTVSNVSVKQITFNDAPALVINNTSGVANLEVRASSDFNNQFMGLGSGASNVSGYGNLAVGSFTLQNNVSGSANTALGQGALQSNVSGSNNTAIGFAALNSNTSGELNVALGNYALEHNLQGTANVAIGSNTLQNNTDGYDNIAVGHDALIANTTGAMQVAIGSGSLASVTTAGGNTAVGYATLRDDVTGYNNTAIGQFALQHNTWNENTAVGTVALRDNTTGGQNTALGTYSLSSNTTGNNNLALGYSTLNTNVTGNYNTAVGDEADVMYSGLQGATAIGSGAAVGSNNTIILGYNSNYGVYNHVGIGTSYAQNPFEVAPNTYDTGTISQSGGSGTVVGSGTSWNGDMVGATIFYPDGSTGIVTAVANSTHLTSSNTTGGWPAGTDYAVVWGGFNVNSDASVWLQPLSDTSEALAVVNTDGHYVLQVSTDGSDTALTVNQWDTGNLLEVTRATDLAFRIDNGGAASFRTLTGSDSATAFQVKTSGSSTVLDVDTANSRVGIGSNVTSPSYTLDVQSSQSSTYVARIYNTNTSTNADGLLISLGVANGSRTTGNYFVGFSTGSGTVAGKIQGGASAVAYTTTGADYAEYFLAADPGNKPQTGQIVSLASGSEKAVQNAQAGASSLVGVISDNPGFLGNGPICNVDDDNCDSDYAQTNVIVGMTGQLPTAVSDENGAIVPGDPIAIGSVPGVGVKATGPGAIIGYAMENFAGPGEGTIQVYINPGYYTPAGGDYIQNGGNAVLSGLTVGGTAQFADLNASGTATINDLSVTGAATINQLTVTGAATIADLTVTGSAQFAGDITVGGHIITSGGQPTSQPQAAAGTAAAVSVDGTDTTGTITITTGSTPTAGDLAKILFSQTYGKAPHVVLSASNDKAAALHFYKGATSATDFMFTALDAPAPNTTYTFDYVIAQ